MEAKQGKTRILMFPWLAYGHICPSLELAKRLSDRNFHIYFCSTPINLVYVKKKLDDDYLSSIHLVELHLPSSPDLPPHYHTTNGLPTSLMPTLKHAVDMSERNFSDIIETLNPDLVIFDCVISWAQTVASSHNVPAVLFLPTAATVASFGFHMITIPGKPYPYPEFYNRKFKVPIYRGKPKSQHDQTNRDIDTFSQSLKQSSKLILVRSFREIEGKHIDYLSFTTQKKVVPVGPLVEAPISRTEDDRIIQWLDKKEVRSTVFVCFGSECFLTEEEIQEMGHGLDLSGVNFIWVIWFPVGEEKRIEEAVPKGFLQRVGERGMVVDGWAPQAKILEHSSIGGFVSHCGWSSVMESLSSGIPIIAVPMQLDQPLNAGMLEEVSLCTEVPRDENGKFNGKEVAELIRKIVVEKDGESMRTNKARELCESIRRKGEEEIDEVAKELSQLCQESKLLDK